MGGGEAGEGLVDAVRPQALAGVLRVDARPSCAGGHRPAGPRIGASFVRGSAGVVVIARGGRPGGHLRGAGLGPGAGHGPACAGGSDGARAGILRPSTTPAAWWVCVGRGRRLVGVRFRRASAAPAARNQLFLGVGFRRPPATLAAWGVRVARGRLLVAVRFRRAPAAPRARSSRLLRDVRFRWPSAGGRPQLVPCTGGGRGRAAPVVGRPSPGAGGIGPSAGCAVAEVLPGRPPHADAVGAGTGRSGRRRLVRLRRGRAGRGARPSPTLPRRAVG